VTRTLVAQVMTTPVVTAPEAMPFRDLVALLHARDIGAVPVVAPDGEALRGLKRGVQEGTARTAAEVSSQLPGEDPGADLDPARH
jgi:CBS domain-containing protein